jgi:hypothetical protein
LKDCERHSYKGALIKALEYEKDLRKHGEDPSFQVIKKLSVETMKDVAKDYFDNECDHLKPPYITRRLNDNYIKETFGHLLLHNITTPMVLNLIRTIKNTLINQLFQMIFCNCLNRRFFPTLQ